MKPAVKGLLAYLALLLNLVLAVWMIFESRKLYLLLFTWIIQRRETEGSALSRATYGLQTVDALLLVVLALVALGLLIFIETRYRKTTGALGLGRKVSWFVGLQLFYLGTAQIISDAALGSLLEINLRTALTAFEVAAGVNLIWLSGKKQTREEKSGLESQG